MARNGTTAPAGNGSAPSDPHAQSLLSTQGVEAARGLMGHSLASLTGVVTWLEQLQALNSSALSGWSQAIALCSRDLEQAQDLEQFMALPAQMANHQLEQASRQLNKAMQDLFDAQVTWADHWRRQIADQMQQAGGSAMGGGGTNRGLPPASAAAIGQVQDQWLAMTRKWIDAMGFSAPAHPEASGR